MQVDSKPEELDAIDRDLMRLKIEREALRKEADAASRDRLAKLEKELADLEERSNQMTQRWEAEKGKVVESQKLKEELERARTEVELAQRRGDLGRASELMYGTIPQLEKKLASAGDGDGDARLVNEAVTEEGIAGVVSRWTGIPVEKMLEGERAKLIKMEDQLRRRVVGQEEALEAVSKAVRRARAGLQDPNRPIGRLPVPRPDRRRQDGTRQGARRLPVRRRAGDDAHRHVRIHGEARRLPPGRRPAGLCRLRRGRRADRGDPPTALPGHPVRRGREGA